MEDQLETKLNAEYFNLEEIPCKRCDLTSEKCMRKVNTRLVVGLVDLEDLDAASSAAVVQAQTKSVGRAVIF